MIDQAHLAGFIVDSLLIVATALVLIKYWSKAGLVLLGNFVALHIFVYFVLTQLSFWQIFYVDYHLYLALFGLVVFFALNAVSNGYALLKIFIIIEVALHLAMIITGVMYSKGSLDKALFTVIYDSYPYARILLASFQIVGLVTNVDRANRRGRDVYNSRRPSVRNIIDNFFWRRTGLLRVERQ